MNPLEKRLAVLVEDHKLDYANLWGVIPEWQYGAGTVIVWDKGYYEDLTLKKGISINKAFENGKIEVFLSGKKFKGKFVLVRINIKKDKATKNSTDLSSVDSRNWILIKSNDDFASKENITKTKPNSVLSGKSIEQVRSLC